MKNAHIYEKHGTKLPSTSPETSSVKKRKTTTRLSIFRIVRLIYTWDTNIIITKLHMDNRTDIYITFLYCGSIVLPTFHTSSLNRHFIHHSLIQLCQETCPLRLCSFATVLRSKPCLPFKLLDSSISPCIFIHHIELQRRYADVYHCRPVQSFSTTPLHRPRPALAPIFITTSRYPSAVLQGA